MFLYFQSVRLTRLTKQIHSVSRPNQHLTTDAVASSKHFKTSPISGDLYLSTDPLWIWGQTCIVAPCYLQISSSGSEPVVWRHLNPSKASRAGHVQRVF